jgi:hypothetical protein
VTDEHHDSEPEQQTSRKRLYPVVVSLLVVALFASILMAKAWMDRSTATMPAGSIAQGGRRPAGSGASVTSTRGDALADYEAARKTGRPIYILFHSLS